MHTLDLDVPGRRPPFRPPRSTLPGMLGRLALTAAAGAIASSSAMLVARPWLVPAPVTGPLVGGGLVGSYAPPAAGPAAIAPPLVARHADFGGYDPTPQARQMADWVVGRADNGPRPFMILDKTDARVYLFTPDGHMLGNSPVLLGKAIGDDSVPGIGERPINQIRDDEKTTPAGRFQTSPGKNLNGEEVVWVDYEDAISMHRVRKVAESEHRLERLATPTPDDNRISFGCINVPVEFFNRHVVDTLGRHPGVAYVIPEVKTIAQVFEQGQQRTAVASVAPAAGGKVTTDR